MHSRDALLPLPRQRCTPVCVRISALVASLPAGSGACRESRRALSLSRLSACPACQTRPAVQGPLDRSERWRRSRPVFPKASRSPDPRVCLPRSQAPSRLARLLILGSSGVPEGQNHLGNVGSRSRPLPFATPVTATASSSNRTHETRPARLAGASSKIRNTRQGSALPSPCPLW